ncbi:MAG: hypothetical protein NWQ23_13720 [Yoonia sp.]|nr:hypothetical protein [Yoonia sp.]MDP5086474.1 hypothetical protein [Yoonia sp.]
MKGITMSFKDLDKQKTPDAVAGQAAKPAKPAETPKAKAVDAKAPAKS